MAAVEGRCLNLEDFIGLNWNCWVDGVNILTSDETCAQGGSKYGRSSRESVSLWKEDMHIYGECPSRDDFYLVVCGHCSQVVKPQAFERHCERRHGLPPKTCGQGRHLAPQPRPRRGCPANDGHYPDVILRSHHIHDLKPVKTQKKDRSLSSAVNPPALPLQSAFTLLSGGPPAQSLGLGCPSSSTNSPAAKRSSRSPTPPLQGPITQKQECDLKNQSCAPDPGKKPPCKRIYNTKVVSVAVKWRAAGQDLDALQENINMRNCHILRASSQNVPEDEADGTVNVEVQTLYPFNQNLLSSEENEGDELEDAADLSATPWHPKPLGLCTFGCRPLGCSLFTFDRRLHHLRFALAAMLERHVTAQLWKKIPQASSTLRSRRVAGSSVKSGPGRSLCTATATSQLESAPQGTNVPRPASGHAPGEKTSPCPLSPGSDCKRLGQKRKADSDSKPLKCQRLNSLPCDECVSWTGDGASDLLSCAHGNGKRSKRAQKTTERI
ncbi:ataxin-7-like protein 2 isoform X2 [Vanacampus margaritifer]